MLLVCAVQWGCVRRRLTIRSNPPGALVYVDDQEIGFTPVSTNFTYYGTRKIQLIKDGFETVTVKQRFWTPWYEIPPLDFFSENLWPGQLRDERVVDLQMQPQRIVPFEELRNNAQNLRASARQGYLTPMVNPNPIGSGVVPPQQSQALPPLPATRPATPNYNVPPGASSSSVPLGPGRSRNFQPAAGGPSVQGPLYP